MSNQNKIYDTIIIGAGPAGFTAAIYAARREMRTMIISKDLGGQISLASEIENYPGFKRIEAFDLISKMNEQVTALGVEIKLAEVKKIEKKQDEFCLHTQKEKFHAKTIIIAMGLQPRRLAIPGEEEFAGKGISYCANCDGPFYKGKVVAVVGGGNAALDAAEVLSKIGSRVYLIHRREDFRAFEALVSEVKQRHNIECILNSEVKEILGHDKVEKLKIFNSKDKSETEIAVDGLFIEIGRIAHTDLVDDLVERDELKQIKVDERGLTKTPGVFAAGDVTPVEFKQITVACGSATLAALSAYQYLQMKQGGQTLPLFDRSTPKSK